MHEEKITIRAKLALVITSPILIYGLVDGLFLSWLKTNPAIFFVVDMLFFLVIPCLIYRYLTVSHMMTRNEMGLNFIQLNQLIADGLVCTVVLIFVNSILGRVFFTFLKN